MGVHNLFTYSPIVGHFCCFQFGIITTKAANDFVQVVCGQMYQGVWGLGHQS